MTASQTKDIDTKSGRLHLRANKSASDLRERLLNAGVDVFTDAAVDSWAALTPQHVAKAAGASQRSLYDLWPKELGGIRLYRDELYDRCWGEILELSRQYTYTAFGIEPREHVAAEARVLVDAASRPDHPVYNAAFLASAVHRRAAYSGVEESANRKDLIEHFASALEVHYKRSARSNHQADQVAAFIVELLGVVLLLRQMFDPLKRAMSDREVEEAVLEAIDRPDFGDSDPMGHTPLGPINRVAAVA
jgi:AcrR family transcriptional regulator